MKDSMYISIKVIPMQKIVNKVKNHEFRKYIPKRNIKYLFVYTTMPKGEIRYILELGKKLMYPEKINVEGDGNQEFNEGTKPKCAYEIIKVLELENSIKLRELKAKYEFNPPQAYAYQEKYPQLTQNIIKQNKTVIWERDIY